MLKFFFQRLLNLPVIRNEQILNVQTKNRNNFGILLVFGKCVLMTLNSLVFCFKSLRFLWVDFVVRFCFWCRFSFYCKYFVLLWVFAVAVNFCFCCESCILYRFFASVLSFFKHLWVCAVVVSFCFCCRFFIVLWDLACVLAFVFCCVSFQFCELFILL